MNLVAEKMPLAADGRGANLLAACGSAIRSSRLKGSLPRPSSYGCRMAIPR